MRKLVTVVLLGVFLAGCGRAAVQVRPLVAESRRPEARELPVDPAEETLPEGTPVAPGEDMVEPLEEGSCVSRDGSDVAQGPCPSWSGIAVSEARAVRDGMYRIRYRELRRTYESDRQVWAAHRELYEAQVERDRQEIERLQPTWWDQHGIAIGVAAGVVVGAAVTIAITYAVEQVTE